MKILRPLSSAVPSVQPQPAPPAESRAPEGPLTKLPDLFGRGTPPPSDAAERPHYASGQSILVGGSGNSRRTQSVWDSDNAFDPSKLDTSAGKPKDAFDEGAQSRNAGLDPLASGSSVRGSGGGHSGAVCTSFVPPDGKAEEAAPKPNGTEWGSKIARAVAELMKTMQADPPTEVPAEGARGGRISTGESSRKSGSTHSKGAQAREGAEEDAAPPQDSSRVASNG
ncbi:hypothetical protein OV208_15720 [Corallococcus sp. bb12-1]|uniref:hypothetical protein n=1 Tax=Corallococcus sp. bb12-1 TaxID=2996784 RepID=UPI00226EC088|nr:hypothetical protein [Corallococcus sp. bb12-1]MCY1042773.1 hypothetical protein [Corallococcus sp. bb12-1]